MESVMCPLYIRIRTIKQYPPCKLEQHPSIPSRVISISFLLAVTFLLRNKCGSDKHPTVRTSSPTARLKQHVVGVSPVQRRKWIQAACKLIKREGRGGRRFTSVQSEKTFPLDLTLKRKTDEGVLMLYVMEDWPIAVYNQMTSLGEFWHRAAH